MKYFYQGVNVKTSETVEGELDGVSDIDVVRELSNRGIEAISVRPHEDISGKSKTVTASELTLPLQELATLTESGVALVEAVSALSKNKEHPGLAKGFKKIASLIESGESFSNAIKQSSLPFPEYVSHLVSAGELSGELAVALRNASEQMNYDEAVKNEIKGALTYPAVLVGSGLVAMIIIFFAVVPKFSHMLEGGQELPLLAWLVLSAGKFANEHPVAIFGGLGALIALLTMVFTHPRVKKVVTNASLNIPVIGPWLEEQDAAKWASLSSAMLGARVGLVNTLTLASESSMFDIRKLKAKKLIDDVQSGMTLTESLERSQLLPPSSLNLIAVGDKTGQLATMLGAVAKLHDEACKRRMKQVLTLVEPVAILVVGVMIGIMILGIVLAITASTDIAI